MFYPTLLPISILLSLSAAQITTTTSYTSGSTSVCGAQPVLEACLASTQAIAAACASTDYQCLCQKYTDILTCFLQCPNDARYTGVYNTQVAYCNDASVYSSSTTAISRPVSTGYSWVSTATTTSSTSALSDATTTKNSVASSTSSGTGSSTASATGNSGVKNGAQMAGGLVIAAAMALL